MEQNCIFCQIAGGKVPAKKVYEDERCVAVLDINPAAKGHILLMPKTHAAVLPQLSDEEIGHMLIVAKSLSNAQLRAFKAGGTSIFLASGAVAGQRAPHLMLHIIPRKDGDGLGLILGKKQISPDDLAKAQDLLLPKVKQHFGLTDEMISKWKVKIEKTRPEAPPDKAGTSAEKDEIAKDTEEEATQDESSAKPAKEDKADLDMIADLLKR
jgi:histidine triad (HIT) family protein